MPGFINEDESESRRTLYKDLLTHLNTTIFGESSSLPYSASGKHTLDFNPVEAFDREKNPEGAIFSEPDVKWTEAIAKTDAVKMLAKGAKQFFGKALKRVQDEALAKEGWTAIAGDNSALRANVKDIITSARNTPQAWLTPLKETKIFPIEKGAVAGRYYPKGYKGRSYESRVEIDPAKGMSGNTWFHEIVHGRNIDAPFYAKNTDEMTAGDVYKRYLERVTSRGAEIGELVAEKTNKRFYWDNPKELIARDFASRATSIPPEFTSDSVLMEETYTKALESTFSKMVSKAPKFTKRMSDRIKTDMKNEFPGLDWEDLVKKISKDRGKYGTSYEAIEDTPLSDINPSWFRPNKKVDVFASEIE